MTPSYYNTLPEPQERAKEYTKKAQTQDDIVMEFFERNPAKFYTPIQVWAFVVDATTPLTSIRRSMSTLTKKGKLLKCHLKKQGNFGRANSTWCLNAKMKQTSLLDK